MRVKVERTHNKNEVKVLAPHPVWSDLLTEEFPLEEVDPTVLKTMKRFFKSRTGRTHIEFWTTLPLRWQGWPLLSITVKNDDGSESTISRKIY